MTLVSTGDSAPPSRLGQARRSRAAILRDAQEQLSNFLDAVVDAAPADSPTTLVSAAGADAADQVAEAITTTLQAHGRPGDRGQSHLLCDALAAVAHAMKAGANLAKAAITKSVASALISFGVPRLASHTAARAAGDTLMKLVPVRHWEDMRRAVQLLAVSLCPDVANHPEVEQYCVQPLASKLLSGAIQQELAMLKGDSPAAAG